MTLCLLDNVLSGRIMKNLEVMFSCDQKLAVDQLEEIKVEKHMKDNDPCSPSMHTAYRSVLGQLNRLQSRTQCHICYRFSRCASAAAKPTIADVREINKTVSYS